MINIKKINNIYLFDINALNLLLDFSCNLFNVNTKFCSQNILLIHYKNVNIITALLVRLNIMRKT